MGATNDDDNSIEHPRNDGNEFETDEDGTTMTVRMYNITELARTILIGYGLTLAAVVLIRLFDGRRR